MSRLDAGQMSFKDVEQTASELGASLAAPGCGQADLVIGREDGSPIHPRWPPAGSRRLLLLPPACPRSPLHGLRHSYATAALDAGIPAKLVQERLGHSIIRVTLDTSTHPSDEMARKAAEDVAALLFGGPCH